MSAAYYRYFKITSGPLIDEVKRNVETNQRAFDEYQKILADIGADDEGYYHIGNRLTAVKFKFAPDPKIFKRHEGGWYPKKSSKAGREIIERLDAVKTESSRAPLAAIGLDNTHLFDRARRYRPSIIAVPDKEFTVYGLVPWKDVDPEVIDKYKKNKMAGTEMNRTLDYLLWEPTPEMEPVKLWQVEKHINAYNMEVRNEPR